ncbi:hypothetical protein Ahy_A05g022306 isoform D [Arachis hypogaea]|uniref:Uncharacterized protein n=2 Tax=Arachis hypogaea TaxID=3818 RepID=A0A445D0E3_ARAHY|nr:hypothetical protein Ahy_A05g022306 isoform D [Arachis hypogaea]
MIPSWKSGSLLSNRSVQDLKSFSSFIMAILLRISDKDNHTCGLGFSDLVSQIGSMSFDSTGLHWR